MIHFHERRVPYSHNSEFAFVMMIFPLMPTIYFCEARTGSVDNSLMRMYELTVAFEQKIMEQYAKMRRAFRAEGVIVRGRYDWSFTITMSCASTAANRPD